jgi:predicted nucleic acid-binding protein
MLIDSSAWIEFFKGNNDFSFIFDFIENNNICTNDVILTELLPSMIHKKEYKLIELMNSIYHYDIDINWNDVKEYQIKNLQHGNNNVPITDVIIAQNCIENNLTIVTRDKHFGLMAKYLPISVFENAKMFNNTEANK